MAIPFILFSCEKDVGSALSKQSGYVQLRKNGDGTIDSTAYISSQILCNRDIIRHQLNGEKINVGIEATAALNLSSGGGCNCNGYTCNNINVLPTYCGINCDPAFVYDPFFNRISAIGTYGADPRQKYYVYYPDTKNANSPVVVLVPGGAWFSGPNPDNVNGWPFSYSEISTDNLVKDLLNNGYVVVSMLYRLSRHGITNTQITSTPIKIADQVNDINSAVLHIKNNFPDCLSLNTNSLQILGESAGGHLSLLWAYTQANTSYVKSVISCYAPTDLNDYADYLYDQPQTPNKFICNGFYNPQFHFPFWFPVEDINIPTLSFNHVAFNCSYIPFLTTSKVFELKKTIQSVVATIITNPYTHSTFFNNSPCNKIGSPNNIPTFIMHGDDDKLVPYIQATEKMKPNLIALGGGLLHDYAYTSDPIPTTYPASPKHIVKKYNAPYGHGFGIADLPTVRGDIVKWLNGHL
jgi:acetyl esterase/lipase